LPLVEPVVFFGQLVLKLFLGKTRNGSLWGVFLLSNSALEKRLLAIDGKSYKAYGKIRGEYAFSGFSLSIDKTQADPFASPSCLRAVVPVRLAGFPKEAFSSKSRETAFRDFLARKFGLAVQGIPKSIRGTGKSGIVFVDTPAQTVLERTAVVLANGNIEARFFAGLPGFGRRVAGKEARQLLLHEIPRAIKKSLFFSPSEKQELLNHVEAVEDAVFLREKLEGLGLVAFVANGSVLPRESGVSQKPLAREKTVLFSSPESLKVCIELPNRGRVEGMGIPKGITLIVGGGYHGKSTLLNAIQLGVYNHVLGDGRELVVTNRAAVKIRAEDGRRIEKVDISPFISNLPLGKDTRAFSTENASGSTSQAANIVEAIEAGAKALLLDEDTSATNFMIRDHRMQELVPKEKEPITPFIDKARQLFKEHGISTILVMGGSGDYFEIADTVILMENYLPKDCTKKARWIAEKHKAERKPEGGSSFGGIKKRAPLPEGIDPSKGKKQAKISARETKTILFGRHAIDLSLVEQLVQESQLRAIGWAIHFASRHMDGRKTIPEILELVSKEIASKGLEAIGRPLDGSLAEFRPIELAAAMNRLRTLKIVQAD
jgi:predicted ABC-class ATPase